MVDSAGNCIVPYGLHDGLLVHVRDVLRGKACQCTCPACGRILVARKGDVKVWHFAHQADPCAHYPETVAHLLAKKVIEEERRIFLPGFDAGRHGVEGKVFEVEAVKSEKVIGRIRPDLMVKIRGKWLLVEICVSNPLGKTKIEKVAALGMDCLEIHVAPAMELRAVRNVILNGKSAQWILNRKRDAAQARARIEDERERKIKAQRDGTRRERLKPWQARLQLPNVAVLEQLNESQIEESGDDKNTVTPQFGVIIGGGRSHPCPKYAYAEMPKCWRCPHYLGFGRLPGRQRFVLCTAATKSMSNTGRVYNDFGGHWSGRFEKCIEKSSGKLNG